MKVTKSASRYAKALLELAIENNKIDSVLADMQEVVRANSETKEFQLFLDSPIINSDKKISVINEIFGQFDELSSSFVTLIAKNKREGALVQIADSFISQVKTHLGIVPVTLVSAQKLDEATKKAIITKLEKSVEGKLEIDEKIDTSLIGGFVIKMGDTQIDASVSNKLRNLQTSLTR
ncbi:MAG: ATP synthase F1 subunit delta [Bacteroidota bacterium]